MIVCIKHHRRLFKLNIDMNDSVKGTTLDFYCVNSKGSYPVGEEFKVNYILMVIFDLSLAPISFILNLLVLLVLAKHRSLRTVPNCILISLAFSDMITGLLIQPMKATFTCLLIQLRFNCALYLTALQLGYLMGMTSYLSLTLMAVERYIAIFHPFRYQQMTASRLVVVRPLVAIWLFSLAIMGLSFLTPQMSVERLFVIALIPSSIVWTAFVYIRVTVLVKKINNRVGAASRSEIEGQSTSAPFTIRERKDTIIMENSTRPHLDERTARNQKDMTGEVTIGKDYRARAQANKQMSNSKATRLVIIIMITICLCYIPSSVLTCLRDYAKLDYLWVKGVHDWGTSFVLLNSTLNPIIYCLKLKDMRKKMKLMLQGWWKTISCHKECE